ncbi:MAG: serine hydrolase domain-containing protein [Acidobacteriota bacterium]|nr:serine hydrolase domain-containing protein [Acidobacteriota bacterium]
MKKLLAFSTCLFLFWNPVFAGELETVAPSRLGLSAPRLERIAPVIQRYIDEGRIAGAVTLVSRNGRIAHLQAHGMADVESNKPMETDSIFRMFSMTKQITSVAVLMLWEEGHFNLTDPVSRYIPEFAGSQVLVDCEGETGCPEEGYTLEPARREITIQHLLSHTSGISYIFQGRKHIADLYLAGGVTDGLKQTEGTIGDMVKNLAAMPLYSHPGENFEYGLSTDVLGYFVEVISGKTLADFCQERIFDPLDMEDTHFFLPQDKLDRLTAAYSQGEDGKIFRMPDGENNWLYFSYSPDFHYNGPTTYYSGGAGVASTARDYARFLTMLLNEGRFQGKQLLGRKTVELMRRDHRVGTTGAVGLPGYGFGLGPAVHIDYQASARMSTPGEWLWAGLYYTWYQVDPAEGMVSLVLCQVWPYYDTDLHDRFHTLVYQSITGKPGKHPRDD